MEGLGLRLAQRGDLVEADLIGPGGDGEDLSRRGEGDGRYGVCRRLDELGVAGTAYGGASKRGHERLTMTKLRVRSGCGSWPEENRQSSYQTMRRKKG